MGAVGLTNARRRPRRAAPARARPGAVARDRAAAGRKRRWSHSGIHEAELGRPARCGERKRHARMLAMPPCERSRRRHRVPAHSWQGAPSATAQTRSATVGCVDRDPVGREVSGRLPEPGRVAGNPVEEDHNGPGRMFAGPAAVVRVDTVARDDESTWGVPRSATPRFRQGRHVVGRRHPVDAKDPRLFALEPPVAGMRATSGGVATEMDFLPNCQPASTRSQRHE